MPHYLNGREAKVGEVILCAPKSGPRTLGILVQILPACTTCNGYILPLATKWAPEGVFYKSITPFAELVSLGECIPILPADGGLVVSVPADPTAAPGLIPNPS